MIHRTLVTGGLACLLSLAIANSAPAQDGSASVEERLRRMQEQMDAVVAENERMRDELSALRARSEEGWLTERRADEIRTLVADVLADADVRSSLLNDGMMAGWNDGFYLASPDDRFRLQIEGQLQTRFVWNYLDDSVRDRHRSGWEVSRARVALSGHVFSRDVSYLVRFGVTRDEPTAPDLVDGIGFLFDAWMRFQLNNETSIRVGQFKAPFMREELVSSSRQLTVERSLINENMSIDRTQGAEIAWAWDDGNLRVALIDAATDQNGVLIRTSPIGGSGISPLQEDTEITVAARYEHMLAGTWSQFEDFTSRPNDEFGLMAGVGVFYQQDESNGAPSFRNEVDWAGYTVDLSLELGGANAFASFTQHYFDSAAFTINMYGITVQGGYYISPKFEMFGRFEYGWWDLEPNNIADFMAITAGANYYIDGHDLKWTTDVVVIPTVVETFFSDNSAGVRPSVAGADTQVVFRTQIQLLF